MKDAADNRTIDAFEKKPMTAAERQAAYRAKNADKARINCYISDEHKKMLDELRATLSIEAMLEKLIEDEYTEMQDTGSLYNERFKDKIKRLNSRR